PLESRRVRTQPCTRTCLPIASAFRACATLIFSMTASPTAVQFSDASQKRRRRRFCEASLNRLERESPVLLVGLLRGDLLRDDQAAFDLLALGINVHAAGALRVVAVVAQDVDVEDEGRVRHRLEPVDVVLAVGYRRALARLEQAVNGRPDQVVILVVLDAV